jgi:hypothetical protein
MRTALKRQTLRMSPQYKSSTLIYKTYFKHNYLEWLKIKKYLGLEVWLKWQSSPA